MAPTQLGLVLPALGIALRLVPARSDTPDRATQPEATRTAQAYASLATALSDQLMPSLDSRELRKELPQLMAETQTKIVRLRSIKADHPMIGFVANEAAKGGTELLAARQQLEALNHTDPTFTLAVGLLGLYLSNPGIVAQGATGLLDADKAARGARSGWIAAVQRTRAAQLMLPAIAQELDAAAPNGTPLGVDFDESWGSMALFDSIALRNSTGRELHNCTLLVEIRSDDEVRQNVHFLPAWKPDELWFARYGAGMPVGDEVIGRQTVSNVEELRVSYWAEEVKAEDVVYPYAGPERDHDWLRTLASSFSLGISYVPTPLLGIGRCVDLTLVGTGEIPAHTVSMVFYRGAPGREQQSFIWERGAWPAGETRRFDTTTILEWEPESVDIEIALNGADAVWRHVARLPNVAK